MQPGVSQSTLTRIGVDYGYRADHVVEVAIELEAYGAYTNSPSLSWTECGVARCIATRRTGLTFAMQRRLHALVAKALRTHSIAVAV